MAFLLHRCRRFSPGDCGRCHTREVDEFLHSHHSKAGRIMGSLDNDLAEVVEGNRGMKTEGFPDRISAAAARSSSNATNDSR